MKKLISILTLAALLVCAVTSLGCGSGEAAVKDVAASALYQAASAVSGFGTMTPVPASDYSDIYGIDTSKIADSAWYCSENSSLNADEIAIFKVSDPAYAETLKGIFESRIARQLEVAKTYSPDEAAKLEKAKVTVVGNYVFYCIGAASDAMTAAIETALK